MDRWHRRRIALIGDAAHALTLFSGRGAACAFSGGNRLAQALIEEPDVTAALTRYEREMRPLIDTVQMATRKAVKWYVPRAPWQRRLRDGLMACLPNAFFQSYFRRKYSQA
jgi:2-polyprenyl-6-methoxyphenol hydroxylase-like FAD-dependent oxidoreductase